MASSISRHSYMLNIFVTFLFISANCDAGNSIQIFKLKKGLKLQYYDTEADSLDLPIVDAYDLTPPSLASPPLNQHYYTLLAPSPIAHAPKIDYPPHTAPTPNPYGDLQLSKPPEYGPSPAQNGPVLPPHYGPTQPIIQPKPALRPAGAPRQGSNPNYAVWCVARPTVPETQLQKAMDYACGTGADCGTIQPNGPCFVPNTLVSHASYAFNSYWQRTKIAGGTCDFGGNAMLITVDPSYNGCHFVYT